MLLCPAHVGPRQLHRSMCFVCSDEVSCGVAWAGLCLLSIHSMYFAVSPASPGGRAVGQCAALQQTVTSLRCAYGCRVWSCSRRAVQRCGVCVCAQWWCIGALKAGSSSMPECVAARPTCDDCVCMDTRQPYLSSCFAPGVCSAAGSLWLVVHSLQVSGTSARLGLR